MFEFIRNASFSYAVWQFAYQYYTLSRYTPFYLKQQSPPEEMTRKDDKLDKTLSFLNILIPLIQSVLLLVANLQNPPSVTLDNISVIGLCCIGLFQSISVLFLLCAVLNIRKHLSANGPEQVNLKMLSVNLAAFGLYLASLVVYYVFYMILYSESSASTVQINNTFISWIVSAVCSTIA